MAQHLLHVVMALVVTAALLAVVIAVLQHVLLLVQMQVRVRLRTQATDYNCLRLLVMSLRTIVFAEKSPRAKIL